jgi:murein DD-endopeptidase MepM/ murein hydrolase activator NlpD
MASHGIFSDFWKHRFFVSVALSETSAHRGLYVRSIFLVGVLALGTSIAFASHSWQQNDTTTIIDVTKGEIKSYQKRIAELEKDKEYQEQQFNIFAQELGTLQARLERFDAISEKIINDKDVGRHLSDDEGGEVSVQGSASDIDFSEDDTKSIEELKLELSLLSDAADHVETAFDIGMNLISENYMNNLHQPYTWPALHKRTYLSSHYGWRKDPFSKTKKWHAGVDIAGGYNAPIVSSASGLVVFSGYRYGYGIMVEVMHAGGYSTRYGHMNKALVENGAQVKAGDVLGLMGSTGRSTGPHLHFEVLLNDKKVDPLPFIRGGKSEARRIAELGEHHDIAHAH